jgi:lysozyme
MTNHVVHGLDLSRYQGPWDFVKSIEAGIQFAYIRAGGAYKDTKRPFTDYRFRENARHAEDAGMPAGFYWYFVPHSNATEQADYFCDLIHNVKWQMEPVGDFEYDAGLSPQQVTDYIATFAARVYDNLRVWIDCYSRSYWLHDETVDDEIWDEMKVWIARYKAGLTEPWEPGETAKLKPPYWNVENVWQYTEKGVAVDYGGLGPPHGDDDVDLNWFHGTQEEFNTWIGADQPTPTPKAIQVDEPKNAVLRDQPKGKIIANVPNKLQLVVIGTDIANDGSIWFAVGDGAWINKSNVIEL